MPIHLPPLSRRQFLGIAGASLAAGAGWIGIPSAVGDDAVNQDPHRFVLFSDTHIAHQRDAVSRGTNMFQNMQRATAEVLGLERKPAGVLINGDCAFLVGQSEDYAVLLELLAPLRQANLPVHLLLGNHDHREHFWQSDAQLKAVEAGVDNKQVSVLKAERANFFLLDSLQETNVTPGQLGEQQLDWLARALDAHADRPAIIMAHHNPVAGAGVGAGLTDWQALRALLAPRRQVKAFLFGHTHHWQAEQQDGIHLINLPPVAYPFNKTDPSGWVDLQLGVDGASLVLKALNEQHPAQGQRLELAWRAA